jgi:hypothetical protein
MFCSSVARYSSTELSLVCPSVEEINDTGFPALRRFEAKVLLITCSPLASSGVVFLPRTDSEEE